MTEDPYRMVSKRCSWCARRVQTHAYREAPLCRGCRAKRRNLLKGRDSMRGLKAALAYIKEAA